MQTCLETPEQRARWMQDTAEGDCCRHRAPWRAATTLQSPVSLQHRHRHRCDPAVAVTQASLRCPPPPDLRHRPDPGFAPAQNRRDPDIALTQTGFRPRHRSEAGIALSRHRTESTSLRPRPCLRGRHRYESAADASRHRYHWASLRRPHRSDASMATTLPSLRVGMCPTRYRKVRNPGGNTGPLRPLRSPVDQ
jgi:hypothetical protein